MAMGSSVPPRAYTREILTTAFNWLQSQPDSVRAKATTPDALVALYVQAQRGGASAQTLEAEAPKSAQAFMSDLKNLAEGLKEFDDARVSKSVTPPASARAQIGNPQPPPAPVDAPVTAPVTAPAPVAASMSPLRAQKSVSVTPTSDLNEKSLQMLREVQMALNLTSEVEAMNLMIAVAHKNLKSLL